MSDVHEPERAPVPAKHDVDARMMAAALASRLFGAPVPDALRIDRFVIAGTIGRGANGTVFAARDTELQRDVAIKLVAADATQSEESWVTKRMLREAQALARTSHPNVVEIYAAGVEDGRVWIAMELVRGTTLAGWAAEHVPDSVDRFEHARALLEQAARGLDAAHRAGIVHRDFKPANVLVGDDGRVRVADFGLARPWKLADVEHDEAASSSIVARIADGSGSTTVGTVVGTPRYMAPEQMRGQNVDAKSDQFAFAVTAWHVVFGAYPFAGETPTEWLAAMEAGRIEPPASGAPRWIAKVLRRALAADPADRWPSMAALADALAPRRTRGRVLAAVAAAAIVATGAGWLALDRRTSRCAPETAAAEFGRVWNAERSATIAAGVRSLGLSYVEPTIAAVDRELERRESEWVLVHVAACESTWREGAATEAELDLRMACLRERLVGLDAVLARLESPSRAAIDSALVAVRSAPSFADCTTAPARAREEIGDDVQQRRLADARADLLVGDYEGARALALALAEETKDAGVDTLRGDALEVAAQADDWLDRAHRAEWMREAYELAAASGDDRRAHRRASQLASASGMDKDFAEAHRWLRHADALRAHLEADPIADATAARGRCAVAFEEREFSSAVAHCEDAFALLEEADALGTPLGWNVRNQLANALVDASRFAEADPIVEELYRETVADFGPWHPKTAKLAMNRGRALGMRGDHEGAITWQREGIAALEHAYGGVNHWVSGAYNNLATDLGNVGDFAAAEDALEHALAACPPDQPMDRADVLRNFAGHRARQRRHDEQVAMLREALAIAEANLPAQSRYRVDTKGALGGALADAGRLADAERILAESVAGDRTEVLLHFMAMPNLAIFAAVAERDGRFDDAIERSHAAVAACVAAKGWRYKCVMAMARLASAYLGAQRRRDAETWVALAGALAHEPFSKTSGALASLRLARARLSWDAGDRSGAHALAQEALRDLDPHHDVHSREEERRLKSWLDTHTP